MPKKEATYPKVIETFNEPSNVHIQREPSCFNAMVRIDRFRVTIEKIEEPREVLLERLRMLWRTQPYNSHHRRPIKDRCAQLGMSSEEADEFLGVMASECKEKPRDGF